MLGAIALTSKGFRQRRSVGTGGIWQTRCGSDQLSFSPLRLASKVSRDTPAASASGHPPKGLQPRSEALLDGTAIGGDLPGSSAAANGERRKRHYRQ